MSKLMKTKDYSRFKMHPMNRQTQPRPLLLASMKEHGFMPSSPIQVMKNGDGRLQIIRGHHRFETAKRLKLPIYYVEDKSNTDIFKLEGDSKASWSVKDFAVARSKAGDKHCHTLLSFAGAHKLPIGSAAVLLTNYKSLAKGGFTGLGHIRRGTFEAVNIPFAKRLARIIDSAREAGVTFATMTSFVMAIKIASQVEGVDLKLLENKIKSMAPSIRKRGTTREYLEEIEIIYNHGQKKTRIPLKFLAEQEMKNAMANAKRDAEGKFVKK